MKKKITDMWRYLGTFFKSKFKKNQAEVSPLDPMDSVDSTQAIELESKIKSSRLKDLTSSIVLRIKSSRESIRQIKWKESFSRLRSALTWDNIKNLKTTLKESSWREKLELFVLFLRKIWRILKKYLEKTSWGRRLVQYIESGELQNLFFSPDKRGELHRIFLVLFFVSLAFIFGKILAMVLRPSEIDGGLEAPSIVISKKMTKEDFDKITQKNLFQTKIEDGPGAQNKKIDLQTICDSSAPTTASRLPLNLVSAIILQNAQKSLVIIEVKGEGGGKEAYREGEKVKNLARIDKISNEEIILKNWSTGDCESIRPLEQGAKNHPFEIVRGEEARKMVAKKMEGIENVGNRFAISRKIMNKKLEDLDNILSQARAVQLTNPDGSLAFKITEIVPGSIFSYLGIENNDTITSINGRPIRGLNEVMNMFANIQGIEHLELSIRKEDGNEQNQEYSFTK